MGKTLLLIAFIVIIGTVDVKAENTCTVITETGPCASLNMPRHRNICWNLVEKQRRIMFKLKEENMSYDKRKKLERALELSQKEYRFAECTSY